MKYITPMTRIGCLLLIITGLAWSQSFTATVRGVVTDPSGAAVPDAITSKSVSLLGHN